MRTPARTIGALWLALASSGAPALAVAGEKPVLSVRITSPLGRTGVPGTVRIVAQIQAMPGTALQPVQFFVDGTLLT